MYRWLRQTEEEALTDSFDRAGGGLFDSSRRAGRRQRQLSSSFCAPAIEQEEACPTPLAAQGAGSLCCHLPLAPLRIKREHSGQEISLTPARCAVLKLNALCF